jgi:hypothetical protein
MAKELLYTQVKLMHEFQKNNNISRACITNTKYVMDCLGAKIATHLNVRPIAAIVLGQRPNYEEKEYNVIDGHVTLMIDDEVLEPSYEVESFSAVKYFFNYDSYAEFIKTFGTVTYTDLYDETKPGRPEKIEDEHKKFIKIASGLSEYTYDNIEHEYYCAQAQYVNERLP